MQRKLTFIAILLLAAVTFLPAQTVWKADKAHSGINFTVTHLVISQVAGRFTDFDITLVQGKDDFSGSTIEATAKTASVNTDNEFRDKHLKSDDFFNAEKYPELRFKSTSFEKTGDNTFKIAGLMTIRDVTKPVVFDGKLLGTMKDAKGGEKAGFTATAKINRFDFGVKWDRRLDTGGLVVSENIDIAINAEFAKAPPAGSDSK